MLSIDVGSIVGGLSGFGVFGCDGDVIFIVCIELKYLM